MTFVAVFAQFGLFFRKFMQFECPVVVHKLSKNQDGGLLAMWFILLFLYFIGCLDSEAASHALHSVLLGKPGSLQDRHIHRECEVRKVVLYPQVREMLLLTKCKGSFCTLSLKKELHLSRITFRIYPYRPLRKRLDPRVYTHGVNSRGSDHQVSLD